MSGWHQTHQGSSCGNRSAHKPLSHSRSAPQCLTVSCQETISWKANLALEDSMFPHSDKGKLSWVQTGCLCSQKYFSRLISSHIPPQADEVRCSLPSRVGCASMYACLWASLLAAHVWSSKALSADFHLWMLACYFSLCWYCSSILAFFWALSPLHPAFSPLLLFSLALWFQDAIFKRPCHVNSTHTPVSHPPFALLFPLGKHANLCFQKILLTCVYIYFESWVFEHELEPAGSHLANMAWRERSQEATRNQTNYLDMCWRVTKETG